MESRSPGSDRASFQVGTITETLGLCDTRVTYTGSSLPRAGCSHWGVKMTAHREEMTRPYEEPSGSSWSRGNGRSLPTHDSQCASKHHRSVLETASMWALEGLVDGPRLDLRGVGESFEDGEQRDHLFLHRCDLLLRPPVELLFRILTVRRVESRGGLE